MDNTDDPVRHITNKIIYRRKVPSPGKLLRLRQIRHRRLASLTLSIKNKIRFGLFTSVVILTGILVVCFTSPKPANNTCKYIIKSEAQHLIKADSHPTSLASGDFNHDNLLDIVISNSGSNTIGVFLRQINNTFANQTTYSTGLNSKPSSVTVADFNHDHQLDIAVANFGMNNIGMFMGDGNGSFILSQSITAEIWRPQWIRNGDLNHDSHIDLVTVNYGTNDISILKGDGNGNFYEHLRLSTGFDSTPYSLMIKDLNRDDHLDIIVTNYGTNNIGIFFGYEQGTFTEQIILNTGVNSRPYSIDINDLNNDTNMDIVVSCSGTNNFKIFFGFSNGSFTKPTAHSTGNNSLPLSVVIGDFNNDDHFDIIVGNYLIPDLSIFYGNGHGTFSGPTLFYTNNDCNPHAIISNSFNNDTHLDIAIVNHDYNYLDIVLTQKNYDYHNQTTYKTTGKKSLPSSITMADFNNDNWLDVVVANYLTNNIGVMLGCGDGNFADQTTFSTGTSSGPLSIANGDFNNDLRLDIIAANFYGNSISILMGNQDGTFSDPVIYPTGDDSRPSSVATGDFNNDSQLDIVVVNNDANNIGIFQGYGDGSFSTQITYSTGSLSFPYHTIVADVNYDEILDILVANYLTNNIGVFIGFGNGSFRNQITYSTGRYSGPRSLACADLNGDHLLDIVVANSYSNQVAILFGYDNGSFILNKMYSTGNNSVPWSVTIADINNDQQLDIIVANSQSNNIAAFFGLGNGNFSVHRSYPTGSNSRPYFVGVNDLNNDGLIDVVVSNYGGSNVGVLIGYGNGSLTDQKTYSTRGKSEPTSIAVGDFNNDNHLDMVTVNYLSDSIDIFLGSGDGSFSHPITYSTGDYSGPSFVIVDDLNNDKQLDIIVVNTNENNLGIFYGYGNGSFYDETLYSTGYDTLLVSVALGDFNNDTQLDMVIVNAQLNNIEIFLGYGNGSFSSQKTYSIGNNSVPLNVLLEDLNNDGYLDIVVTAAYPPNLSIFLGYSNATFFNQSAYSFGNGLAPSSLAVGNLNNDTYLDIVTTTSLGSDIHIFLGFGDGTFEDVAIYSTGGVSQPGSCGILDWNNDGYQDIVVGDCLSNNMVLFKGYGNGTFSLGKTFSTGTASCPGSIAYGYFNDDSLIDIAVANYYGDKLGVFLGYTYMSGEREATYSTGSSSHPRATALADFNKDNYLDIAMANYGLGSVGILLADINATFPSQTTFSTGILSSPTAIVVDDFDNDDKLDVVIANSAAGNLRILYGYENDSFISSKTYSTGVGAFPQSVAIGDFNNDRKLDIAVVNSGTANVLTFVKYDIGAFRKQISFPTGKGSSPSSISINDFNNDHQYDFVIANKDSDTIGVFYGLGNGTFSNQTLYSTGTRSSPWSVITADVNTDKNVDIIVTNVLGDNVGVFLGLADGTFSNQITCSVDFDSAPSHTAVGDFDSDNNLDVVVALHSIHKIAILRGYGNGSFSYERNYSTGSDSYPLSVATVDFNKDGFLDILVASYGTGNLCIFQGYADGTFALASTLSTGVGSRPRSFVIADFNKDAILDIAVANSRTDSIRIFFGDRDGMFFDQISFSTGSGSAPYGIATGDLNNDSHLDIAVANYGSNNLGIFLGCNGGTFFNQLTYSTGDSSHPWDVAVADFDHDHRLDIVVVNSGTDNVGLFFGYVEEDFISASSYLIKPSSSQPTSLAAGDFNNDTRLDVVIANNSTNNIMVLLGSGYGTFTNETIYSTGNDSFPSSVVVSDVNQDHFLDIITANSGADNIGLFLGNGDGTFQNQITYFTGVDSKPHSVVILDFNNDTYLDIAVANYGSNNIEIFFGYGNGSFGDEYILNTGYRSHPYSLTIGDINNDNLMDIIAANNGYGNIAVAMKTC